MPKENITAADPLKGRLVSCKGEWKTKGTSALTARYICQLLSKGYVISGGRWWISFKLGSSDGSVRTEAGAHSKPHPKRRVRSWGLYSTATSLGFYRQLRYICRTCRRCRQGNSNPQSPSKCVVFWMPVSRIDTRGLWKIVFKNIKCLHGSVSSLFCRGFIRGRTGSGPDFDRQTGKWWMLLLSNWESENLSSGARSEDTANPISVLPGPHQKCHGYMMQSISLM